jgi:putative membrane protein
MKLLLVWLLNALALLVVTYFIPAIHIDSFVTALIAAVVIGLLNVLVKPILVVLTLPVTILTLGLFIFVINGALFYAVGHFLQGFHVRDFVSGILGAFLYSVISWVLTALIPNN